MQEDQMNLPENKRAYPVAKNPYARKELWKSQDDLQELINMTKEDWYPESKLNIYRQPTFEKQKNIVQYNDNINV